MRIHLERELKLSPGPGFQLFEVGGEPLPQRTFLSTYHDSDDLRLARRGVTFRHRIEDGTGLWQLKLPKGVARVELEGVGPPARPPQPMLDLLPAYLRGAELSAVARLRTRRDGVLLEGAEVVYDAVAVLEGQHVVQRFRELEIELVDGDERTLERLERVLRDLGAVPDVSRPKVFRALGIPGPELPTPLAKDASSADELAAAFAEQYRRVLRHDPGTRLGVDAEELHQFRVASRRMRAFLRAGRPLLDRPWAESLRAELGWLGGVLGPARDLDVLLERLRGEMQSLGSEAAAAQGLLDELDDERAAAYAAAVEAMSSARYLELLDRLEAASSPVLSGADTTLAAIWWKEWRRTRRAFEALGGDPSDDELHAARISAKRARYAAELAEPELGKRGAAFVDAAKRMQDLLGGHQDAVVAEERIRAWAAANPNGSHAAELLIGREARRREKARAKWPKGWTRLARRARKAKR